MWRIPRVDGLALLHRQLQAGQPLAALDPEQVRARRPALQPALQHRVDLVLGPRPRAHQLLAARQPAAHDAAALIGHPHRLELPRHNNLASVRASSRSVFARACAIPVSSGLTTITRSTCGSSIRATSQQLPVTSNATRSLRQQALGQASRAPPACSAPARRSGPGRPRRSRPHRSRGAHPGRSLDRPT